MGNCKGWYFMDEWTTWTAEKCFPYVSIPTNFDDKYSRGVLGIIAGSDEYPGSAVLACRAGLQTGIGMIRYFGTEKSQMLVLGSCPEVVVTAGKVQAWVIGPGLNLAHAENSQKISIDEAMSTESPVLLDAGGLENYEKFRGPTLITPHYRELARLFQQAGLDISAQSIAEDPRTWSVRAARELNVCVLLKGSLTYVASAHSFIELPKASPWMATAGTGDVLAGIIGALMATQAEQIISTPTYLDRVAATGAFIHAQAAARASNRGPIRAVEIIDNISQVVRELINS